MTDRELLKGVFGPQPGCLSIETLGQLLHSPADSAGDAASLQHLTNCPHCRAEMEMLRSFESGAAARGEEADVRWIAARLSSPRAASLAARHPANWRRWLSPGRFAGLAAVAAAVVLAVGIGEQWRSSHRSSEAVPEFGAEIQRARTVEIVPATAEFAWKPVAGASDYALTARNVDRTIIFYVSVTKTTFPYPPEVARTVSTGKLVVWDVAARDAAGNVIAQSGTQRLQKNLP